MWLACMTRWAPKKLNWKNKSRGDTGSNISHISGCEIELAAKEKLENN